MGPPGRRLAGRGVLCGLVLVGVLLGMGRGLGIGASTTYLTDDDDVSCPTATGGKVDTAVDVDSGARRLLVTATSTVRLTGVVPEVPPAGSLDLAYAGSIVRCLGGPSSGDLRSLSWNNGSLVATVEEYARYDVGAAARGSVLPDEATGAKLFAAVDSDAGRLRVDLCPASSPRDVGRLACSASVRHQVTVVVRGADQSGGRRARIVAEPFPTAVERTDAGQRISWSREGPPGTLEVVFPVAVAAAAWAYVDQASWPLVTSERAKVSVRPSYLAYGASGLLFLVAGAIALRRRGGVLVGFALGLAVLGSLGMSLTIPSETTSWRLLSSLELVTVALLGWGLVLVALGRRVARACGLLAVLASGVLVILASSEGLGTQWSGGTGRVIAAAVAAGLLLGGLLVTGRRVALVFATMSPEVGGRAALGAAVLGVVVFCVSVTIGFPLGSALATAVDRGGATAEELLYVSSSVAYSMLAVAPIVVAGVVLSARGVRLGADLDAGVARVPLFLALVVVAAVPWSEGGSAFVVVSLPLWVLQVVALVAVLRWWTPDTTAARLPIDLSERRHLLEVLVRPAPEPSRRSLLDVVRGRKADVALPPPTAADTSGAARRLLLAGPSGAHRQWEDARVFAAFAGVVGIAPVAYFVWSTLGEMGSHLQWSTQMLVVAVAVTSEAARWVVAGLLLGLLYPLLPGRIGPVKALVLAAAWTVASLVPTAIARALDIETTQELVYRSAQLALVLCVTAVLADHRSIVLAGGGWWDLREAYALHSYANVLGALTPAVLLVITLAQQLLSGSGLDVAASFLSGVNGLVGGSGSR